MSKSERKRRNYRNYGWNPEENDPETSQCQQSSISKNKSSNSCSVLTFGMCFYSKCHYNWGKIKIFLNSGLNVSRGELCPGIKTVLNIGLKCKARLAPPSFSSLGWNKSVFSREFLLFHPSPSPHFCLCVVPLSVGVLIFNFVGNLAPPGGIFHCKSKDLEFLESPGMFFPPPKRGIPAVGAEPALNSQTCRDSSRRRNRIPKEQNLLIH